MKSATFYTALLITTSYLFAAESSYSSDQGQTSSLKSEKELREEIKGKDEDIGKRVKKRSDGRKLQEKGQEFEKKIDMVTKPLSTAGTAAGFAAAASGDPHAKMGVAAFKLSIMAIEKLGQGIAKIIIGVGRYQERSQEILSNIEVLLEDLQKSIDKINSLEKKRNELLSVEKPSEPVQRIGYDLLLMSELPKDGKPKKGKVYLEKLQKNDSKLKDSELKYILMQSDSKVAKGTLKINTTKDLTPDILNTFKSEILEMITKEGYTASKSESRLKQLGKGAANLAKTAEIKVRQAADILTNDKVDREEKLKAIQADLKIENENYDEIIRLLQIILMQDALSEISKKIDIDATIATLESNARFYKEARDSLSKNKSKRKKQAADIEKKEAMNNKSIVYYMKFQKAPTETPQELEKNRSELDNKIKELTQLTKMGDAIYLQKKEVQLDSEMNRGAIVSLYRENDAIKSQLETLKKQLEALLKTALSKDTAGVSVPPLKKEASQREPLSQKTPSQGPGPLKKEVSQPEASKQATTRGSGALSEEVLKKQRESLRPIPTTPQGR